MKKLLLFVLLCAPLASSQPVMLQLGTEGSAALTGSVTIQTSLAINLSNGSLATLTDWRVWGSVSGACPGDVTLSGGAGGTLISTYAHTGTTFSDTRGSGGTTFTWTNGTPTASNPGPPNNSALCYINAPAANRGYTGTISAGATPQTAWIWVICNGSTLTYKFTATLSDGSAAPYTNSGTCPASSNEIFQYKLNFNAATNGQTLTWAWVFTNSSGTALAVDGAAVATGVF